MNIWQIDPAHMTPYYNRAVCMALAEAGCEVRYITSQYLYDEALPPLPGIQTDYLYFRGLNQRRLLNHPRLRRALRALSYPLSHGQLVRQIRQKPPDIAHFQWSRLPRLDSWLIEQIKRRGVPIVHTVHDVVPMFDQQGRTDYLERVYTSADRLVVHTRANREALLARYPRIDPACVRVVPHIELKNETTPPDADRGKARAALGLPTGEFVILFFGSIRNYKGLDVLVQAYERAARPGLRLIVVGRPESPREAEPLRALANRPDTLIQTDYIPHDAAWQYHLAADVIVFPYRAIYQSGALITAMTYGRAVIVTRVGGLPETVDGNGWIVPPEDPAALTQAIQEAASDPHRVAQMGRRSLELIAERHSGRIVAEKLLAVYRELVR